MEPEGSLPHSQVQAACPYNQPDRFSPCPPSHFLKIYLNIILSSTTDSSPRQLYPFRNKASFYGEEVLPPLPKHKLEGHTLSAVRDCLFNIFATTLHTGGLSSIRNPRTRHAVVTGTHLSKFIRTRLEAVGLRVLSVHRKRRNCPSARCASAANANSIDSDVFNGESTLLRDLFY
jgi:hypothetical protein